MDQNQSSVARFTNITESAWSHPFGGILHSFEAGESRLLPYHVAKHLAKHLATQMFLMGDKSARTYDGSDKTAGSGSPLWTDESLANLQAKIITEIFDVERPKVKTEMELMQEKIDQIESSLAQKGGEKVTTGDATTYKDKSEVIAALKEKGISFDARANKSKLEELLK